jgi:cytochrome c2
LKTAFKIFVFTILVAAFYSYVGQMVPQKITYPPETKTIGSDLSVEEMVEIGQEIVVGKGTCLTCHTIGSDKAERFPDLGNIGIRANSTRDGYSDVEYLAESLYEPDAHIVEGFPPGMPEVSKPPISLTDEEILTVIAYLQSLGGVPTVTMQTKLDYQGQAPAPSAAVASSSGSAASAASKELDGPALFAEYACVTCHSVDAPTRLVGPSLYDVGKRLNSGQIYESILDPEATIAEGYPNLVMANFLEGMNFYNKVSSRDIRVLVEYLSEQRGE